MVFKIMPKVTDADIVRMNVEKSETGAPIVKNAICRKFCLVSNIPV